MKTIIIKSEFIATTDIIWNKLLNIGTLKYITKPMMSFELLGQNSSAAIWEEGKTYPFKIRLFGLVPIGKCHTVNMNRIDKEHYIIETHEHNKTVTVWNHRIELVPLPSGNTLYSDIVGIYAGWLTPVVALWGKVFYKHRQKRWKMLLNTYHFAK